MFDSAYALCLLSLAVVFGYGVFAPTTLPATPLPAQDTAIPKAEAVVSTVGKIAPPAVEHRQPADARPALAPLPPSPPPRPVVTSDVPWPSKVSGRVLDPERQPVAGAAVAANGRELQADSEGSFTLVDLPAGTPVIVKVPGYERVILEPTSKALEVVLKPLSVKAAYLTYFGFADRGIRGRVVDLLENTELNGVVIDVKGDRGWIPYRTEVRSALAAGAQGPVILRDFDDLIAGLKSKGVYTIARIVTFKDNVLAHARPELAIIDSRTGNPWVDQEKLAWVDPFREETWTYNIEIAKEAARKGFDEIQFDYVRFPTDGRLAAARYSRAVTPQSRLATISGFLARARRELGPLGVFVAADTFGYTAFNNNDTDIGQRIEELAAHLDFICPMVYPSGYHLGVPGYRNPVTHPYQVVYESVRLIRKRSGSSPVRVRPWLQDFKDYAFDRRVFGPAEIRAQISGSDDAGGVGWMLWNPRNRYTAAALNPKGSLAAR
ncbi:MAG: putative glycoside hydrolase [Candidatus Rokuibacteriota bacterium]